MCPDCHKDHVQNQEYIDWVHYKMARYIAAVAPEVCVDCCHDYSYLHDKEW